MKCCASFQNFSKLSLYSFCLYIFSLHFSIIRKDSKKTNIKKILIFLIFFPKDWQTEQRQLEAVKAKSKWEQQERQKAYEKAQMDWAKAQANVYHQPGESTYNISSIKSATK